MWRAFKAGCVILVGASAFAWSVASFGGRASDCAAEADRASRSTGTGLGSVGRGAARGAIFGAIVGDSGKSARRGAALGALGGGLRHGAHKNNVYNSVYDSCMGRY